MLLVFWMAKQFNLKSCKDSLKATRKNWTSWSLQLPDTLIIKLKNDLVGTANFIQKKTGIPRQQHSTILFLQRHSPAKIGRYYANEPRQNLLQMRCSYQQMPHLYLGELNPKSALWLSEASSGYEKRQLLQMQKKSVTSRGNQLNGFTNPNEKTTRKN